MIGNMCFNDLELVNLRGVGEWYNGCVVYI